MSSEVPYHPTIYRIVSMEGVDPERLRDASAAADMKHLAALWQVKIVSGPHIHPFEGGGNGFTGIAVLAQSHFNIHSWPEVGRLDIDVGTCGDDHRLEEMFEPSLLEMYSPRRMESTLVTPRNIGGYNLGVDGNRLRIYWETNDVDPITYPQGRWQIFDGKEELVENKPSNLNYGRINRGNIRAPLSGPTHYPF